MAVTSLAVSLLKAELTGTAVPITTTVASASSTCVAILQGQVLNNGVTAVLYNTNGGFITLNSTCQTTSRVSSIGLSTSVYRIQTRTVTSHPSSTASPTSTTIKHNATLSPGMIAGLVLAIVAVLVASIGAGAWLWYRRRSRRTVIDLPAKVFDEDASGEISFRWEKDSSEIREKDGAEIREKDGTEIREKDGAEIKEMSVEGGPFEICDARSIRIETGSQIHLDEVVSPVSSGDGRVASSVFDELVSPISPK